MKRSILPLFVLFAVACAAEPETGVEPPPAPAESQTPPAAGSVPTAEAGEDATINVIGGTRLGRFIAPDWERVEGFTKQFYAGELDALYANFSDDYKPEFSRQDLTKLRDHMLAKYGEEQEVVATRKQEREGYVAYFRASRFSGDPRLIEVAFVIGPDQTISGLAVTPDRSPQPTPQ